MSKRILPLLLAFLLLTGCASGLNEPPASPSPTTDEEILTVHYIDVGQADSILLTCGEHTMLIDGGNRADGPDVVDYLAGEGITRLDYAVATHPHEDHIGGLPDVIRDVEIGAFLLPEKTANTSVYLDMLDALDETGTPVSIPAPGDMFSLGSCSVEVLGPVKVYEDANNNSIVLRVTFGETSFLFTGDMEALAEHDVLAQGFDLSSVVLKLGHHGSSSSSSPEFLDAVDPVCAIISCETGNDYGHPHRETVAAMAQRNITTYRTDTMGTVIAESDGASITFYTESGDPGSVPGSEDTDAVFIGNRNSKKVHSADCSGLPAEGNRVCFDTLADALNQGYEICGQCNAGQ